MSLNPLWIPCVEGRFAHKEVFVMTFFGIVIFLEIFIVSSVMNGWVLTILWEWFIVPTFGLPELTVVPAIGLAMVVGLLTHQNIDFKKEGESELGERLFSEGESERFIRESITPRMIALLKPLMKMVMKSFTLAVMKPIMILAIAWVVNLFM